MQITAKVRPTVAKGNVINFSFVGKCDLTRVRYQHGQIITKFPEFKNLCCSPREMSDISLIYLNEQGSVFQRKLPNMVVESCDCA